MHPLNQNDEHFQFNIYITKKLRTKLMMYFNDLKNLLTNQNVANRNCYMC